MQGREFIRIAGAWCVATGSAEPTWRSSVSRAYYGAMHHCLEFLTSRLQLEIPANPKKHETVPWALGFSDDLTLKEAGHRLADLKSWRHQADYELLNKPAGEQIRSKWAVEQASEIEGFVNSQRQITELAAIQSRIAKHFGNALAGWRIKRNLL